MLVGFPNCGVRSSHAPAGDIITGFVDDSLLRDVVILEQSLQGTMLNLKSFLPSMFAINKFAKYVRLTILMPLKLGSCSKLLHVTEDVFSSFSPPKPRMKYAFFVTLPILLAAPLAS